MALQLLGLQGRLPVLLCSSASGWPALDCVTYLPGAQEHRYEVPEPRAQPHQQPQGSQEPRPEAERAQRGHLLWAYCQDDGRGESRGRDLCVVGQGAGPLQPCPSLRGSGL